MIMAKLCESKKFAAKTLSLFLFVASVPSALGTSVNTASTTPKTASGESMSDAHLIEALQKIFAMHFKHNGRFQKKFDRGYGLGCKKDRDFLIHWSSTLTDISVRINDNGIAKFDFELDQSKAYVSYTGNTSLCMFKGYFGDVLTNKIHGSFQLVPQVNQYALVQVNSLDVSRLTFANWTLFEPFLLDVKGDAPDFLNDWIQKSFNGIVKSFLNSSFSKHLNQFISKKIDDELKKRYDGGVFRFEQVRGQSFHLN